MSKLVKVAKKNISTNIDFSKIPIINNQKDNTFEMINNKIRFAYITYKQKGIYTN